MSSVAPSNDRSYGIIPMRQLENTWEFFLVKHNAGHWAFPKGHPEASETPQQTACRELVEETGLVVDKLLSETLLWEEYSFLYNGQRINKTEGYFPARVSGTVALQGEEIAGGQWFSTADAETRATFPQAKQLCKTAAERFCQ